MISTGMRPAILERLEGVKESGARKWSARCPAHDDQNASLSIGLGKGGRVLLKCHAGCDTASIVRDLGLDMADLMGDQTAAAKPSVVATYDYRDEQGELLYQVVRMMPKDFRQRKPDGKGGWLWTLKGVRRVLYKLPELLNAEPDRIVLVAEGEKDVHALERIRFLATTNAGGAGKWRADYSASLSGRHVVILPDNDKVGREHAATAARSLQGVAESVKVVELPGLPDKGDPSDWLAAGGTAEALEQLIRAAPTWEANDNSNSVLPLRGADQPAIVNAERVGGGEDSELHVRSLANIVEQINKISGGWPRRVGNTLFIDDPTHGLHQFAKPADLFGWLHSQAAVSWHRSPQCVGQAELFCELQRTAQHYSAIEGYPHFPQLDGHYYSHPALEPGDGTTLRELLDRFCPESPVDADLILALIASAAWGGAGGTRPAFVIVSDDGRGVGKSKLIEIVGILFGGFFAISADDRAADIAKRLLTPEAATKRITLYDNVKTNRLSWGEYESLITARDISGHRLYAGERTRPNTLLWCLTLNGPSMSRDMAQRSVIIKLRRPEHSGTWEDEVKAFVETNRWQIMADLAAYFQRPAQELQRHSRWGTWEREVLSRLPEPADAQQVILERQGAVNADDEEAQDVADFFRQQLESLGYDPDADTVHVPNELAREWFVRATGASATTTGVSRAIRQAHDEGTLPQIAPNPCRSYGRGFLWMLKAGGQVHYDIADRQRESGWQENRHWDR